MKTTLPLLLVLSFCLQIPLAAPGQSTAFNYSGQLNVSGTPANGFYDFIFTLMTATPPPDPETSLLTLPWSGMQPLATNKVAVSNGAFTVTLNYGAIPFDGSDLLVAIQVRTNYVAEMIDPLPPPPPFTELNPPQPIPTMPYAIRALNAGTAYTVTGPVPDASIPSTVARLSAGNQTFSGPMRLVNAGNVVSGTLSGDGSGVKNVQFGSLDSGGAIAMAESTFVSFVPGFAPANYFRVADFNRDGWPDIANLVFNTNLTNFATVISTNDGHGNFVPGLTLAISNEFVVVDLNRDGFPDILSGTTCHTNVSGQSFVSGYIGTPFNSVLGFGGNALVGQLNGDGDIDVVQNGTTALNYRDGKFLGYEIVAGQRQEIRTPSGFPLEGVCSSPIMACTREVLADMNGDGLPDLVARPCGSNSIAIITNRNAGFECPWSASTSAVRFIPVASGFQDFRAADFDGDGLADILTVHFNPPYASNVVDYGELGLFTNYYQTSRLSLLLNRGSAGFVESWVSVPLTNLMTIELGDLNRDGRPDVVALQWTEFPAPPDVPQINGLQSFVADGRGGFTMGAFSVPSPAALLINSPGRFEIADANGDGVPDAIIGNCGIALAQSPRIEIRSTANFAATSSPPFTVASTSHVDNLNADLLDGFDAAAFVLRAGDAMTGPLVAPSFAGDGSALTALNAGQLTSGTVADARLSSNIARRGGVNSFTSSNTFSGVVTALDPRNQLAGNAAGLTNLPASNLVGVIGAAQISGAYSGAVTLSNTSNAFLGSFIGNGGLLSNLPAAALVGTLPAGSLAGAYSNAINLTNAANTIAGDGGKLTSLDAGNIANGAVADARLTANVMLAGANQTVTGTKLFAPPGGAPFSVSSTARVDNLDADLLDGLDSAAFVLKSGDTMTGPLTATAFLGDGSGLTGLSAVNISSGLLPLTRGGTGASTPANARANINAAIRGANTDITSLSGLTTPLSVAQGGSGASDPTNALKNLGGAALAGVNVFSGTNQLTNSANVLAGNGSAITLLTPAALSGPVPANRGGIGIDSSGAAAGSILRTTGSGIWDVLPPGAEGRVLKVESGLPAWSAEASNAPGLGLVLTGNTFSVDFEGSGSANTVARSDHSHDAASIESGLLADERLGGTYSSALSFDNVANFFHGNGAGLTSLNASSLTSGKLPNDQLAGVYSSAVTLNNAANNFTGIGSGLTSLNASQLASGTVPDTRMSPNIAFLNLSQNYSGTPHFNGGVSGSTPPFIVDSSTVVTDLNADLLDGMDSSAFASASHNHDSVYWKKSGNPGTTSGTDFVGTTDNQPLEFKVNSLRALRLEPTTSDSINVIGGWRVNQVAAGVVGATIAGGGAGSYLGSTVTNRVLANFGTVGGGGHNAIYAFMGTIGGGEGNIISNNWGIIAGGYHNAVMANSSSVGGGENNTASGASAVVSGGGLNQAGPYSAVGGGYQNKATGSYGAIPGGTGNTATNYALAAGRNARATNDGSFVWADSTGGVLGSTNDNAVTMRAAGGYRLFTDSGATTGARLAPGGGSWTSMSDRNAKENFAEINGREVLEKVAALPVSTWNYKSQRADIRHIGPIAQDFKSAFGVGESDTGITSVDADGVALAAIKGLNQKLIDELKRRDAENAELKQSVEELRAIVSRLADRSIRP